MQPPHLAPLCHWLGSWPQPGGCPRRGAGRLHSVVQTRPSPIRPLWSGRLRPTGPPCPAQADSRVCWSHFAEAKTNGGSSQTPLCFPPPPGSGGGSRLHLLRACSLARTSLCLTVCVPCKAHTRKPMQKLSPLEVPVMGVLVPCSSR